MIVLCSDCYGKKGTFYGASGETLLGYVPTNAHYRPWSPTSPSDSYTQSWRCYACDGAQLRMPVCKYVMDRLNRKCSVVIKDDEKIQWLFTEVRRNVNFS